jgi:nitroimidazol reductase NimA-like FMN-containing flavoprotein (pyridoxamine 5'-phosphate oxidase superfamily)
MPKLDVSLTSEELEVYLREQRSVRVATVDGDGVPHVIPLWFVWRDGVMYLNSTLGNVTVDNALATGRASAVADDGETYDSLRGVVVTGTIGRVEDDSPQALAAEESWSEKYFAGGEVPYRRWRDRAWFRIVPERVASWDFRKIPEARARRDAAREAGRS